MRCLLSVLVIIVATLTPATAQPISDDALRTAFARPTAVPFPANNRFTAERELLGRTLFFDPRLSGSNLLSCGSCHNPAFGWGDGQAIGRGHAMVPLTRRSPSILNLAWSSSFFWDGRAPTLEVQALGPLSNPIEMNMQIDALPGKLAVIPGYRRLFEAAYPGETLSLDTITRAIATFERGLVSGFTAFDRWVAGDDGALSPAERRGLDIFVGPAGCAACHAGWNFTDGQFHDTGLPTRDLRRAQFNTQNPHALFAFKTPGLRDVGRRAPYMHNGSLPTLESVVEFYESGGEGRPSRSPLIRPFRLTEIERAELLAFLGTLTAPPRDVAVPSLPR
ncbi:cytochrome-c peroxidase [Paracraurococcus lichenis]|uniref:Cytochrome c peroxidase n=1 Tax=Paracraurococcus lichenis TaxID=3064888 RepID=A0ABT9EBW4_9PROT|nr:cytochrome c peroxidase [Paracraurococcus sp. LOR1-02]MDO9713385.1 cytochrome c peroxidase [Paracraurococcus sp. LOR1-02]